MRTLALCTVSSLVLLAAPAVASAQGATFGVKGGASLSEISETDLDSRTGFVAGGFVRMGLGSSLELQAEALYHQKGADMIDRQIERLPQSPASTSKSKPKPKTAPN